jgi:TrpR-related protein YerC/YecD
MEKEFLTSEAKKLFKAILLLKTEDECRNFLRDLCTFSELKAMIERFQVAEKVVNKETYRNISKKTGVSSATVTRVAHWLHHGMGGYKLILKRMK